MVPLSLNLWNHNILNPVSSHEQWAVYFDWRNDSAWMLSHGLLLKCFERDSCYVDMGTWIITTLSLISKPYLSLAGTVILHNNTHALPSYALCLFKSRLFIYFTTTLYVTTPHWQCKTRTCEFPPWVSFITLGIVTLYLYYSGLALWSGVLFFCNCLYASPAEAGKDKSMTICATSHLPLATQLIGTRDHEITYEYMILKFSLETAR